MNNNISNIRKEAKKQIDKCKDSCYKNGANAGNELEGDYGSWNDWEDVLVEFAEKVIKNKLKNKHETTNESILND